MKRKLVLIFALLFTFGLGSQSNSVYAHGTYEIHNDLCYPVTIDLYRIYWEKNCLESNPVFIHQIRLNPGETHTCDFTKTNDSDIKAYQYRIQYKTPQYYKKSINIVHGTSRTITSSLINADNKACGYYRFPCLA